MSPTLHTDVIRSRQQESATHEMHARHAGEASVLASRGGAAIRRRVVGALAAVGLCIAVATPTPVSAHVSQPPSRVGHAATTSGPARFAAGVRKLEHKGYVEWLCTKTGMLMHKTGTGRFATVRW